VTIANMRAPYPTLEKEASRIMSKLPKMIPGKQRGKPVRMTMSIPITFKLDQ
jgi:protein TonB